MTPDTVLKIENEMTGSTLKTARPVLTLMSLAIAIFMLGIWAFWAGFIAPATLTAQGLVNHNSNAPVDYMANRIEVQDRQNRVVLSGDVDISQGGMRLRAANMTVAYRNIGGIEIDRIDATGGVIVTKGDERASGNVGIYDFNRRIITLVGNVALRQAGNTLNGGRLVIDLRSGRSTIDGQSSRSPDGSRSNNGRVSGTFSVPERN